MRNKTQKNGRNSCLQCDKCDAASNDIIATIDAAAIRHNVDYLRSMSKTDIMPVLKANAYGHGAIAVSKILRAHGVRMIGTATLGEALMLRKSGDKGRIVAWLYDANGPELGEAIRRNIDIGIVDQTHVPAVCKLAAKHAQRVRIHLFVDTGINRAGIPYGESVPAALELSKNPRIHLVGLMSHFIQSELPNDATTHKQLKLFRALRDTLVRDHGVTFEHVHIANSGGCLNYDVSDFTLARPGLSVFGMDPNGKYNRNLRPAMTVESRIIQIKPISKGESVGYDKKYTAKKNMVICVAPVGYADIVPRSSSGKLHVIINGTRRKVLGNISMDQIVIESAPSDAVGDAVLLFGSPHNGAMQTVYDVADASDTVTHEVVVRTNASSRITMKYINL
jgi:alanine racemase|uniref:Alanine racemase C-terminal domain-containing protein n=1 Tax=viral metagenome TaxID=1070528 RepID=A0A6C0M1L3_9ZZZZ